MDKQYLTAQDLCNRWRGQIALATLRNWRCAAKGPRWEKIGNKILYDLKDVEAWEKQNKKGKR